MTGRGIILDLCGGSGAWSRPYAEAGYDVRVITLPEYDVKNIYPLDNHLRFWMGYFMDYDIAYSDIRGVFAAPPCTEFSLAKNNPAYPRNFDEGMSVVADCLRIIWGIQSHGRLAFWVLENPVGLLRRFLGKPAFTFRQWQFGGEFDKPTDLWGYFNPPRPTVKVKPSVNLFYSEHRYRSGKSIGKLNNFAWHKPSVPEWYTGPKLDRAALRAITPDGFAQAFYRANKGKI